MFSRLELPVVALVVAGVVATISGTGSAKTARCANDVFFSDQQPAWSPDGKWIAFVRQHRSTDERRIRVVAPDGSGSRALTGCLAGGDGDFETELSWSPDGSEVLYESGGAIRLVRADGSGVRTVASGSEADWSPDGRRVAFVRRGSVFVVGRDGRGVRRLVAGESPDWSTDGTQIAFEREGVRIVGADGSGQRRIARGSNPAWSPKGDLIAAVEYVFGEPAFGYENPLVVFRPDGRGRRVLGRLESESEIRARWSPDGRRVRFGYQIYELGGPRPRRLTVTAGVGEAEWSPDGAALAVSVDRYCNWSIAVLPLDSMRPRVITNKCAILGTSRADTRAGTPRADFIYGGAGNDRIRALAGTDRVIAGHGADRADGGDGDDEVEGSEGNDVLLGARGDDRVGDSENLSEFGNDRLDGGPGADELGGADGRDVLRGGRGRDAVEGGDGRDVLFGGPGDDSLTGSIWDADLGDDARDRIRCGPGYDRVRADRFDLVARDCEAVWIGMRRVRRR